jgi:hypothetical protein
MPLWVFPVLFALAIVATLGSGIWLFLHLTAFARTFAGKADIVPSPKRPRASRKAVGIALAVFCLGLLAIILIQVLAISGQANAWIA